MDSDGEEETLAFHDMGLDDRVLKAIAKLGWQDPTAIQEKAIPLILAGRDVLARGRTGSGKTGSFALPAIQKILGLKKAGVSSQKVRVLVMAPTRELAKQIHDVIVALAANCGRNVRCVDVSDRAKSLEAQRPLLVGDVPDIVVGTPSRVLNHVEAGNLDLKESLELLILDEADLIVSFGYESDVKKILEALPQTCQAVLTSATLGEDVTKLKGLVLHNPVTLKLEEPTSLPEDNQLTQYKIFVEENDKFVLIYSLFKLKLVKGKTIIFVNSVDRCYKVKLFLEQFGIPACVLNSELPNESRCHIVSQFNKGIYDIIVASDEKFLQEASSKRKKDKESGVARGIDFQFVSNIINFDFPSDVDSYVHRVGRTARGNNKGTALSLVSMKEVKVVEKVEETLKKQSGEEEDVFKPYKFKLEELDGFRYRAMDAWRSVTKIAIREARLKEIKQEMLNSSKLKGHFADNPRDLQSLRHDKALHTVKHQSHLESVPEYIVPKSLKKINVGDGKGKGKKGGFKHRQSQAKKKFMKKQSDPLRAIQKGK